MPERSHAATDLDTRLAEIDCTLRAIQAELDPEREPRPPLEAQPEPLREPEPEPEPEREPEPRYRAPEPEPPPPPRAEPPPPPPRAERRAEPPPLPAEPPPPRAEPPPPRAERRAEPPPPRAEPPSEREPSGRHGPLESLLQRSSQESLPRSPRDPLGEIVTLTDLHRRLLESGQDLLAAYEAILERLREWEPPASGHSLVEVTVTAGPFMSLDAVRAFEAAMSTLPGVIDVAVRGYERGNRAIVDVQLNQPRS